MEISDNYIAAFPHNKNKEIDRMIKIQSFILASLLLLGVGCAAISAQYNTMESMKNYTFSESPEVIFAGAMKLFKRDGIPLTITEDKTEVSTWRTKYKEQGSLSHNEKVRYRVVASTVGTNKAIVRVMRESIPEKSDPINIGKMIGDEMLTPDTIRYIPFEYRILQEVNPSAAAAMETAAAK